MYLVTPAGLALSRDRRRWALLAVPLVALLAWMTWLNVTMGQGFAARDNLALPFMGLVNASSNWPSLSGEDWFYLLFALISCRRRDRSRPDQAGLADVADSGMVRAGAHLLELGLGLRQQRCAGVRSSGGPHRPWLGTAPFRASGR